MQKAGFSHNEAHFIFVSGSGMNSVRNPLEFCLVVFIKDTNKSENMKCLFFLLLSFVYQPHLEKI